MNPAHDRTPLHNRDIECKGYLRTDGLYDIEGRITDTKFNDATMVDGSTLDVGPAWHDMVLKLSLDGSFMIHDVEAITLSGPTSMCKEINDSYRKLIGLRIGSGFSSMVRKIFGGRAGCTHLTELLGPIATTAYQTISGHLLSQQPGIQGWHSPAMHQFGSHLVDSCHVWSGEGAMVSEYFPEFTKK